MENATIKEPLRLSNSQTGALPRMQMAKDDRVKKKQHPQKLKQSCDNR